MDKRVGITTTVPVEVIYAAGKVPVDLNNLLIASDDPAGIVTRAERDGLPRTVCAWTKGIYEAAVIEGIRTIVGVVEGDCSNTRAVMERWRDEGFEVIPFAYPHDRSKEGMKREIGRFADRFGVSGERVAGARARLNHARRAVHRIDELTWKEGKVSGEENHLWQVSCSDFRGDPDRFEREARRFLGNARRRKKRRRGIRIGYLGVPPIVKGLYGELAAMGFDVVFNEVQRQFSMPLRTDDIVEQYLAYTYPYDASARIDDILREIEKRRVRALIHYVQSFCHRSIEDYLLRRKVGVPVLMLECDRPGPLDERNRIRLEAFYEMLTDS